MIFWRKYFTFYNLFMFSSNKALIVTDQEQLMHKNCKQPLQALDTDCEFHLANIMCTGADNLVLSTGLIMTILSDEGLML